MTAFELPEQGIVFWPVGVGDSTTIVVDRETVVQVDVHHLTAAEDDDDPRFPIVDHLVEVLPTRDGKPYLAAFAATHLDRDHIAGFADLLARVTIGDLWFTPRIFRDVDSGELCDDGIAFAEEASRRIKLVADKGAVGSGDRIRIIGEDDLLSEPPYSDLPGETFSLPGEFFSSIDGADFSEVFRAFIHSPFKDDGTRERNDTSLGLQISLVNEGETLNALLLGDLSYPDLMQVFEHENSDDLLWNVLLAPHHCSKRAMYWADSADAEATLRQDILDAMSSAAQDPSMVVVSADKIPAGSSAGDNPPHARAANRYREMVDDGLLCTGENVDDAGDPAPIVFEIGSSGVEVRAYASAKSTLQEAVAAARGGTSTPPAAVGFGC